MNTMPLFSELEKLGYKKHSEKSFKELDELPFDSKEITIEKSLVFKWFRDSYNIFCDVSPQHNAKNAGFSNNLVFLYSVLMDENNTHAGVGVSYEEAEYLSLIEIINWLYSKK